MTPDQKEAFEERAAILEFDAGMTRQEAERVARQMLRPDRLFAPGGIVDTNLISEKNY